MPNIEDKVIAMHARHAIAKTILDITELTVCCNRGVIELVGKVKRPRGHVGALNMAKEVENLKLMIRHSHGVRDVLADRMELME